MVCKKSIFRDKLSNESKNEIRKEEERKLLIINNYTTKKNAGKFLVNSSIKISQKLLQKALQFHQKVKVLILQTLK